MQEQSARNGFDSNASAPTGQHQAGSDYGLRGTGLFTSDSSIWKSSFICYDTRVHAFYPCCHVLHKHIRTPCLSFGPFLLCLFRTMSTYRYEVIFLTFPFHNILFLNTKGPILFHYLFALSDCSSSTHQKQTWPQIQPELQITALIRAGR